jgi:uncharacterized membrane protein
MTKAEWLKELENRIQRLPSHERADVMADYREHFEMGVEKGKSEEQICLALGSPRSVAQSISMNSLVEEARTASTIGGRGNALLRVLLLFLVLAPFNFLILVGPFLILFSLLFAGWVTPLSVVAAVSAAGFVFLQMGAGVGWLSGLSLLSMYVGILSLALAICMVMWLATRGTLWLLIGFIKWNIDFITARKI